MAKKKKDSVLDVYTTKITYYCPERGLVEEEIVVKKYKEKEIPADTVDVSQILGEEFDD